MSRVKSNVTAKERSMLNTTINTEILNDFKGYCKEQGIPMNLLLELFMRDVTSGKFELRFDRVDTNKEEE